MNPSELPNSIYNGYYRSPMPSANYIDPHHQQVNYPSHHIPLDNTTTPENLNIKTNKQQLPYNPEVYQFESSDSSCYYQDNDPADSTLNFSSISPMSSLGGASEAQNFGCSAASAAAYNRSNSSGCTDVSSTRPHTTGPAVPAAAGTDASMAESPCSSSSKSCWSGPNRRIRRKEDKVCGVCGDKALSFNFDAISCESCKAFFRRNASKGIRSFKCPYEERCVISVVSRRFCKRCRLRTCFEIGMKKEYILSLDERTKKRQQIDQNKVVDQAFKRAIETAAVENANVKRRCLAELPTIKKTQRLIRKLEERGWLPKDLLPSEIAQRQLLSDQEIDAIESVERAYEASVKVHIENRRGQRHQPSMMDLINLAEISVRRVIEMMKKIPNFLSLSQADQIALLKGGAIELLILRGVISYNPSQGQFLEAGDSAEANSVSMTDLVFGAGGEAALGFEQLARSLLADLQCSHTMLLLLLLICLFSDRPSLSPSSRETIDKVQLSYTLLLEKLLKTQLPVERARYVFPLLIGKLSDLRELNQLFSQQAIQLTDSQEMIPLMNELLTGSSSVTEEAAADGGPAAEVTREGEGDGERRAKAQYVPLSPTSPTPEQLKFGIKMEPDVF